jgi:hypothetical protein
MARRKTKNVVKPKRETPARARRSSNCTVSAPSTPPNGNYGGRRRTKSTKKVTSGAGIAAGSKGARRRAGKKK